MTLGRGLAQQALGFLFRERGIRPEPHGCEVGLLVDGDVQNRGNLFERVADKGSAALATGLLDHEHRFPHDRQPSAVTLCAVRVEILYCPT